MSTRLSIRFRMSLGTFPSSFRSYFDTLGGVQGWRAEAHASCPVRGRGVWCVCVFMFVCMCVFMIVCARAERALTLGDE